MVVRRGGVTPESYGSQAVVAVKVPYGRSSGRQPLSSNPTAAAAGCIGIASGLSGDAGGEGGGAGGIAPAYMAPTQPFGSARFEPG